METLSDIEQSGTTRQVWFRDDSIIDQDSALIEDKNGKRTNGISITVKCPKGHDGVEVLLDYEELQRALSELQKDRDYFPQIFACPQSEDSTTVNP